MPTALLTADEAADMLRMAAHRVKRLAKRREIPCVVLPDGEFRFDGQDLAAWVAGRKQPSTESPQGAGGAP